MGRKRLYLVQVNGRYGPNVYLPYSVGSLWAYARAIPDIATSYEMVGFLYLKEPVADAVAKLDDPDLVCISCYIWNWRWSKQFAHAVKARWPESVVLVGGVQVPDESPRSLTENPELDFAIYGEGEGAFADFLLAHRFHGTAFADYSAVGSLVWRSEAAGGGRAGVGGVVANPRHAPTEVEKLRSPYLDGVFDELLPYEPRWQVLHETTRGCPYRCSFCAWGQAALNDVRPLPEPRVLAEIDWFATHRMDYVDNADANFGLLPRDADIAQALSVAKQQHGYPCTFRTSFAKNPSETLWQAANILHRAGMLKSVTISLQSLDDRVLAKTKRGGIPLDRFQREVDRYAKAAIPTYTELILGLPGESYDSFVDGVERCLEAGQHAGLFTYLNIVLENTEQSSPEHLAAHGIVTADMQAALWHGTPDPSLIRERQRTTIATSTMPHADWRAAYLFGKAVEVFHAQGLLRSIAIWARARRGTRYRTFYSELLAWCMAHPETVAGREIGAIATLLDAAVVGGSWDCVDERLGEISWPVEEFAFARICLELDRFYDEVAPIVLAHAEPDIFARQRCELRRPPRDDTARWARDVVWYGRKGPAAIWRPPLRVDGQPTEGRGVESRGGAARPSGASSSGRRRPSAR